MSRTTVKLSARDYNRAISPDKLNAQAQRTNNKNLVINGGMQVWQRETTATAQTDGAYKTVDRFFGWLSGGGAYTTERSTGHLDTTGHENALKVDVTTADTSIAASDYYAIVHKIEAQNLQSLQYGSSSAKTITLSFWIKATKTGTHTLFVSKNDSTQYIYVAEYTVSASNTWEHKTITIEPDNNIKAGAGAIVNDNGAGFTIGWILKYGSNNDGTANAWQTGKYTTSNQVNNMDSTSNTWFLTGVQMEIGDKATDFEHELYEATLHKCQRYYTRWQANTAYDGFAPGYWLVTTQFYGLYELPVQMRQEPTLAIGGNFVIHSNGADTTAGSLIVNRATPLNVQTYSDQSSNTGTAGYAGGYRTNNDNDAYVEFKAEL